MRIYRLENATMPYAWGSLDGLSRALSIPNPSGKHLAELWMGAHPKASSLVILPGGKQALSDYIKSDPEGCLGRDSLERFGAELPFLFKALSAGQPLSIQVHPGKRKAEHGYERETKVGLPLDAYNRNYRDPNHKPELAVALTDFEALCGFRPIESIIANMKNIPPIEHRRHFSRLEKSPGRIELSVFFYALMTMTSENRTSMIEGTILRLRALLDGGRGPESEAKAWRWVLRLAEVYPDDIGVFAPLIFNLVEFQPGEGIYIAPGEPHAYLSGTALEIMGNSDNVLRGALTRKYIDVPEFISVLSFDTGEAKKIIPITLIDGDENFPCPVDDFSLSKIGVGPGVSRRVYGPEILLCGEGRLRLESEGSSLDLQRGESAFVRADAKEWSAQGSGTMWRARVNLGREAQAPSALARTIEGSARG